MLTRLFPVLVFVLFLGLPLREAEALIERSEKHTFEAVTLTNKLNRPWGMAFLPGREGILITEKEGKVRLFKDGKLQAGSIPGGPPAVAWGQGGLLDIAPHPAFATNRWVYFTFAGEGVGGASTELARARFTGDRFVDLDILLKLTPKARGGRHFGSRLAFDDAGYLYMSSGDRGSRWDSQDLKNHSGGVFRLNDDGTVPADNPFQKTPGAQPEIFSYGHRNAQGMAKNPFTGEIWLHEHGPQGGDEINIVRRGANYGWPKVTFGEEYGGGEISPNTSLPGFEDPIHQWTPSIAPSGMAFYDGSKFPGWQGSLFVGALKFRYLERLTLAANKVVAREQLLQDLDERIRDVRTGPDGFIYVLTDGAGASLLRLEPR